jgi:hypothetical protein
MINSITIGGTINIGNYESLRVEVSADSAKEAISALKNCLSSCALPGGNTQDLIKLWTDRALGGVISDEI